MTWDQLATLAIAVLGAVLGILNTWQAFDQRAVRLRVSPRYATGASASIPIMFSIDVTNLGAFPVTITEVGFKIGRQRALITSPRTIDGGGWPRRLEAREAVSVYFDTADLLVGHRLGKAYARTACEHEARGNSKALEQLRALLNEKQELR